MAETNLKRNKEGYGYKYTELAEIHNYLEQNNMTYYQFIKVIEGNDYIYTQKLILKDDEYVPLGEPIQGCRVVQATLSGIKNPAQEQGSALTYARRYSLLMAFGLATEDDDGASLTQKESNIKNEITTIEQAEAFVLPFGKYKGATLGNVTIDDPDYCNWLYKNEKTDIAIKKAIKMISVIRKENIVEDLDPHDKHRFDGEP